MTWDVAVIGLGVNGAAAACELAARGANVVGIDRFVPPHSFGSSHGQTRIIREAYFEHPLYVPLVRRARELWLRLQRDARTRLHIRTGGVMVGPGDGVLVSGSLTSARQHDVPHTLLDAPALRARFPGLNTDDADVALLEHDAGLLLPEACVAALLHGARVHGATLRVGEPVLGLEPGDAGVAVRTERGTIRAAAVILATGAWLPELLGPDPPLTIERQVFHWYAPQRDADRYRAEVMPLGLWEYAPGAIVATFPDLGHGVKIGVHHGGTIATAATIDRTPRPSDENAVRPLLHRYLSDADWRLVNAEVCMYANTPDEHFVVDTHPAAPRVVIMSACSGHGFKFAPATAELAADLALDGGTAREIAPFRLARLAEARPQSA